MFLAVYISTLGDRDVSSCVLGPWGIGMFLAVYQDPGG